MQRSGYTAVLKKITNGVFFYTVFIAVCFILMLILFFSNSGVLWNGLELARFILVYTEGVFFALWVILMITIFISWLRNPLYKILNLILLSITIVLLWGYYLDFTFILLCYVIAFTSAVVMLFLSVVLMLPLSYNTGNFTLVIFSSVGLEGFQIFSNTQRSTYGVLFYAAFFLGCASLCFFFSNVEARGFGGVLHLFFYDDNFKLRLFLTNRGRVAPFSSGLLKILQKFGSKRIICVGNDLADDARLVEDYRLFILEDENSSLLRWRQGFRGLFLFLKFFFAEWCVFVYAALSGYFFKNRQQNYFKILKFIKKNVYSQNSFCRYCAGYILNFLLFLRTEWSNKKKSYPSEISGWEVPILVDKSKREAYVKIFSWGNPFYVGSKILKLLCLFFHSGVKLYPAGLTLKFYVEWFVQCLVVFIIYSFFVPAGLRFGLDKTGDIGGGAHDKQPYVNVSLVDAENLVVLKQFLYQNVPLFVFVSVNILLVALISASLLKK